jgi:hypothetical protein
MSERPKLTHVRCPRCTLRMRADIWQVFNEDLGACPRCEGLHGLRVGLVWADAGSRAPGARGLPEAAGDLREGSAPIP